MSLTQGRAQSTPFSEHLLKAERRGVDIVNLKNQVLVDIGAGKTAYGYGFACSTGADKYIGIELYHAEELSDSIERARNKHDWRHPESLGRTPRMAGVSLIPYSILSMDMEEALRTLPDNSVSVLATGIDNIIIPARRISGIEYQVRRVLHHDGFFVNAWSDIRLAGMKQQRKMGLAVIYRKNIDKKAL
jgi:hypothetical protein